MICLRRLGRLRLLQEKTPSDDASSTVDEIVQDGGHVHADGEVHDHNEEAAANSETDTGNE